MEHFFVVVAQEREKLVVGLIEGDYGGGALSFSRVVVLVNRQVYGYFDISNRTATGVPEYHRVFRPGATSAERLGAELVHDWAIKAAAYFWKHANLFDNSLNIRDYREPDNPRGVALMSDQYHKTPDGGYVIDTWKAYDP